MNARIRYIGVWPAFKMGCVMAALPIFFLMMATFSVILGFSDFLRLNQGAQSATLSLPAFFMFWAVAIGIGSGISWGLFAFFYNVVSLLVGGIEIRLEKLRYIQQIEQEEDYSSQYDEYQYDPERISSYAPYSNGKSKETIRREIEQKRRELDQLNKDLGNRF